MKRPVLTIVLLLCCASAAAEDRYRIGFGEAWNDGIGSIEVQACFEGRPPAELIRNRHAAEFTRSLNGPSGPIAKRRPGSEAGRHLDLGALPDDACIEWTVDLASAAERGDARLALRVGDAIVSDGDLWFWRDARRGPPRIEVELPAGLSLSAPWQPQESGPDHRVFRPTAASAYWSSRIALGRFESRSVDVPGTALRMAVLGADGASRVDELAGWIRASAMSVASVTGRFPQPEPQVLVINLARGNARRSEHQAVPWAHVMRGGGIGVEFFVDGAAGPDALASDWTATHELSHLLLPYVSSRDRWLSEGLASYYQNVLRARDGRLDPLSAWERLESGFGRGHRATTGGSLAGATRAGRAATMRVYWSGAAIMLKADARLRALSGGRQSLDSALAGLHDCCLDPGRSWRARELFEQLDRLSGFEVFSPLYEAHVMDDRFPDLGETYRQLGLVPGPDGMRIDPDAPWGRIRHFIMNPPATAPAGGRDFGG